MPPKKSEIINFNIRIYLDESNIKTEIVSRWTPSGKPRMAEFVFSLLTGVFNSNILNSIEQHNNKESEEITERIEELYSDLQSKFNGQEEILPSDAYKENNNEGFL